MAMCGSALPSGWPRMGRSGCGSIRFAKSMRGISRPICKIRIGNTRPSAPVATVARLAHGLIKTETDYRPYFEALPPRGALRSRGPSKQVLTSQIMLGASTGAAYCMEYGQGLNEDLVSLW
ncbi:MAG: hypothetical protein LZF60_420012 [Nitrospira sp.]|nr:MAG: hypothetical protein LZF60_420012 [Nitrospira sp.]